VAEDQLCFDGKAHIWWRDPDGDLECLRCGEIIEKKTPSKRGGKDRLPRKELDDLEGN